MAYRLAVLEPAWGVVCELLAARRVELLEVLLQRRKDVTRGRILEIDEIMQIVERLRLEQKPVDSG